MGYSIAVLLNVPLIIHAPTYIILSKKSPDAQN